MTRTILITGASRGIGAAIKESLLRAGHTVIGVARNPGEIRDRYQPVILDLADLDEIAARLKSVLVQYPIDALVSNAGGPTFRNLEELSPEQIQRHIDLNLTSHLLVVRAVLPYLKMHASSDIVLMGSEAALQGGRRGSVYCAAKFGLRGFAQALREECAASGVRVSIIHPGMVRTPFFDDLDFAPGEDPDNASEPGDVASAVRMVLDARAGTVFDEINLSPLKKVVRKKKGDA